MKAGVTCTVLMDCCHSGKCLHTHTHTKSLFCTIIIVNGQRVPRINVHDHCPFAATSLYSLTSSTRSILCPPPPLSLRICIMTGTVLDLPYRFSADDSQMRIDKGFNMSSLLGNIGDVGTAMMICGCLAMMMSGMMND